MKSVRKWIRDIFGFSGNEINGFLILVPLMLVLIFSEPIYSSWVANQERGDARDSVILDSLLANWQVSATSSSELPVNQEVSMFLFDPNTATVNDFKLLGFPDNLAKRIAAYRQKGGVFRIKSDLLRIYGLDSALYNRLYSYIRLPTRHLSSVGRSKAYDAPETARWKKAEKKDNFDINKADTTDLKSVYGIGPRLAARIIKFRDGLGGFVARDQLYEVYGLDTMVVEKLLAVCYIQDDFTPEKININTADEEKLSVHPYIPYQLARLLVSYRFQHGDFREVNDIKKLSVAQSEELERLLPYLKVHD